MKFLEVATLKRYTCLSLAVLTLSACSSPGAQYRPEVNGGDLANYSNDLKSCQELAKKHKGNEEGSTAIGAILGGVIGSSDSTEATIAGAAIGAIVGAVSGDYQTKQAQKQLVISCMQQKGYNVIDSAKTD